MGDYIGSKRGPRLSKAERKMQIRQVARRGFARKGYSYYSLYDMAKDMGVAEPSLYRYFDSKYALYLDLVLQQSKDLNELMDGINQSVESDEERLHELITVLFTQSVYNNVAFLPLTLDTGVPENAETAGLIRGMRKVCGEFLTTSVRTRINLASEDIDLVGMFAISTIFNFINIWQETPGSMSKKGAIEFLYTTINDGILAGLEKGINE